MEIFRSIDPDIMSWVIIPILIFCARLFDVSIGTLRIVFIARGDRVTAPILGFIEVLIWIIAITQVMQNLDNFVSYLAWAGGFAVGSWIGLKIESKLAIGQMIVRVITVKPADELVERMKLEGYRTTCVDAYGQKGKVNLLFMIVKRKELERVISIIREINPKAFYTIEDVRRISETEIIPETKGTISRWRSIIPLKKSK